MREKCGKYTKEFKIKAVRLIVEEAPFLRWPVRVE
jgi:hypothetical protein